MAAHVAGDTRALEAAELAWIAVVPCAILVLTAMLALGPALGHVLSPPSSFHFWPSAQEAVRHEPTEHARYLVALTAPILLTALIARGTRHFPPLRPSSIVALVRSVQVAGLVFVVLCFVVQRTFVFGSLYTEAGSSAHTVYFTIPTLIVAAAIVAALVVGVRSRSARAHVAAAMRETRRRRIAAMLVVVLAVAVWVLPAINFEHTMGAVNPAVGYHVLFTLDEVYAVLNGRSPLVDFAAQYGSLWPYPVAGLMALFGKSIGVFTVVMSTITASAMLAVFGVLRRVVRSTVAALLLFLPLLAMSFFMIRGPLENRYALVNLFGAFPLRYAGPFFAMWLTARHLDGTSPRRLWPVFLLAGLVVMNNGDFGLGALGATIAALLWSRGRPTVTSLRRLAVELAIGLAAAFALVSALTLARAGSLPDLSLLFRYARLFALAGFGMLPMKPAIGVSTVIYLTCVAAIGTATVRAVGGARDRLLTGMLAWSGVFGLGVGSYYMGRSHPEVLTNVFPAWAFSITLLFVVALRRFAARPSKRPALAELACLFGFGLLICALAQTPTPWSQVTRLTAESAHLVERPLGQRFVAAHTRPGEHVAILLLLGHRIGVNLHLADVMPYAGGESIVTSEQLEETLRYLRAAGGHKVFLLRPDTWSEIPVRLRQVGFRVAAEGGEGGNGPRAGLTELVDG